MGVPGAQQARKNSAAAGLRLAPVSLPLQARPSKTTPRRAFSAVCAGGHRGRRPPGANSFASARQRVSDSPPLSGEGLGERSVSHRLVDVTPIPAIPYFGAPEGSRRNDSARKDEPRMPATTHAHGHTREGSPKIALVTT